MAAPYTAPRHCTPTLRSRPRPRKSGRHTRYRVGRSCRPHCHRIGRWSNRRPPQDPRRHRVDRAHHWPRSRIVQVSWPGRSFDKRPYKRSHNTSDRHSSPIDTRSRPGTAARFLSCHRPWWSRRQRSASRTGSRSDSPRCSCNSRYTHRSRKGRVSNRRPGNSGTRPCHRRSAGCSGPSPRTTTSRTPCFPGTECTSQSRRRVRCCRRWSDRGRCTRRRAGPWG